MLSSRILAATAALLVSTPAIADDVKVGIGISGWDRVCAAHARKPGGHLQEERPRCYDQEDPAEGPASGHCVGGRAVRGDHRRNLDFLECQWCCDQADLPARQELRRRWHGNAKRYRFDQGSEGQDGRRVGTRHLSLFRPGLDAQEERPLGQGRNRGEYGTSRGCASIRGWSERCRHDV